MNDAGWILAAYGIVFGGVALYTLRVITRGRALAKHLPDEDKTWT